MASIKNSPTYKGFNYTDFYHEKGEMIITEPLIRIDDKISQITYRFM
jgi:hypothetical protein